MSNILKPLKTERYPNQFLYVGMDIHKDNHTACLTNCFGQVLLEKEIKNSKEDFSQLAKRVERLSKEGGLKPIFGLEDSYGNGLRLATFLKRQRFEVKMVSPVLVDRERKYETHPEKSDSLDALGVAKVLIQRIDSLPNYSITPEDELSKEI
ncbi:IS110 family transposase, partial [Patescibacteria group bacterium]|nr:IS110 family transposase [Patescibacteria group bacterium]